MQQPLMFNGLNLMVSPDHPKMRLPDEVIPGVPWPDGFKQDFDAWLLRFFGTTNLVADGETWSIGKHSIYVNPRTYARIKRYVESASTL